MSPSEVCFFLVFLSVGVAFGDRVQFKDCGSVDGIINYVDVSGCSQIPCTLKRGSNVTVTISFKSKAASSKVTAVVHGLIDGIPVPFPIDQPDGCKCGITCPVTSGSSQLYADVLTVKPIYPELKLVAKWELKDDQSKDLVCMEVPLMIVAAGRPNLDKPNLVRPNLVRP